MKKYFKIILILIFLLILILIWHTNFASTNSKITKTDKKTTQSSIWVENWKSSCISEVEEPIDIQIPYYDFNKQVINQTSLSIPDIENVKILSYNLKNEKHDKYFLNTLNIKVAFTKPGKYTLNKIQFTYNNIKEVHKIGSWDFDVIPKSNVNYLNIISYSIGTVSQSDINHDQYLVTIKNSSDKNIILKGFTYNFSDFTTKNTESASGIGEDNSNWNELTSSGVLIKPQEIKTLRIGYDIKKNMNFNYYFKPALVYNFDRNEERKMPLLGRIIAREPNESYLKDLQTK